MMVNKDVHFEHFFPAAGWGAEKYTKIKRHRYYYVAHYVWPYHETVRMSVCLSVCHVSYLENGAR